jgi:hypothetical protein
MVTVRRIMPRLTAVMPGWLIVICGICRAVPPARLAALLSAAGLCRVQPARVRRVAGARNGGTPQRAFGETPAQPGAG